MSTKVDLEMTKVLIEVVLVVWKGQLVAWLKSAIFVRLFLHSIIGQVDQFIAKVIVDKLPWRSAKIAIVISEALETTIDECLHSKAPNVKLSLVVQSGSLNIFLHNERFLLIIVALTQDAFDFFQCWAHSYSITAVRIFSRFNNPDVVRNYFICLFVSIFLWTFRFL